MHQCYNGIPWKLEHRGTSQHTMLWSNTSRIYKTYIGKRINEVYY